MMSMALLMAVVLAGCGRHDSAGESFADTIASTFEADCLQKQSGTARAVQLRKQLCGCTAEKIRAGNLKASDGDKANDDKIHAAQQACRQQIYGREG
jgi:major membrane immunogen (membrane-anchored lipoprotein)